MSHFLNMSQTFKYVIIGTDPNLSYVLWMNDEHDSCDGLEVGGRTRLSQNHFWDLSQSLIFGSVGIDPRINYIEF